MPEKDKQIIENITKAVDGLGEEKATQFLSFAEGMAAMKKIMEEGKEKNDEDAD